MADTQNFQEVTEIIRKNPGQANSLAIEWEKFIKKISESSPEILPEIFSIKTRGEFSKWTSEHPEKHVDPSIWDGKEISEYYSYLQTKASQPQSAIETKATQANPQEKTEEKRGTGISLSDVNRLIKEVSDAEKNLKPEFPSAPVTQAAVRGFGQETVQASEQMAQRSVFGAGRIGGRVAGQAGRAAAQAGRLAAQAGVRIGAFLATNPVGWVIIGIVLVVGFTFIIVLTMGGGGSPIEAGFQETNETLSPTPQTTITPPTLTPTEATTTPTPAEP